nr:Dihydrofolate reductase [uncultured bacterium]
MKFELVVAADEARGIGRAGGLPWRLPGDMAFFKRVTSEAPAGRHNAVLMGRKTYASISPKFRPLRGRLNVVLSRQAALTVDEGVLVFGSLEAALARLAAFTDLAHTFVIGGGELYAEAIAHPGLARVHLTRVHATFDCDTFLAPFEDRFRLVTQDGPHHDDGVHYTFETYERA